MVGGMYYQNPPPHPHHYTAPDAPRISRRTAAVLVGLIVGVWVALLYLLAIKVLGPWFAGLLNIGPDIATLVAYLVACAAAVLVGVLMIVCPSITRRVRARSAPVLRDQA